MTKAISDDISSEGIAKALSRFVIGDWGMLDEQNWQMNDESARNGGCVLAVYMVDSKKIYIIFDGMATTICYPEERLRREL